MRRGVDGSKVISRASSQTERNEIIFSRKIIKRASSGLFSNYSVVNGCRCAANLFAILVRTSERSWRQEETIIG